MRLSTLFLAALVGLLSGCDDPGKDTGDTTDTDPGVNLDDVDGDGIGPDEDCDDEDASVGGPTTAWMDSDGDGYGNAEASVDTCTPGADGTVTNDEDCDDDEAAVNPAATEVCNSLDDNCDGAIDESGAAGATWYTDADGDGYGDPATAVEACEAPVGAVADGTDCDDTTPSVNPGLPEVCDDVGRDEDCDGLVNDADDSVTDTSSWFLDADADGYGDGATVVDACALPDGYAATAGDCDDADPAYNPGADESDCADPADYNCDGSTGYADADGDGYVACEECDDGAATVNPGAVEVCNGIDDDCDTDIDSTASDAATWYADVDGDTYGDPAVTTIACDAPLGGVADGTDCDDTAAGVNPGAAEVCDGAVDEDCDGLVDDADDSATGTGTWYLDVDGDGYGDPATAASTCTAPALGVADGTDCDDANAGVNPGALEVCDSLDLDEDCDGAADDADTSLSDAPTWYADADGDTFGVEGSSLAACDEPSGYAALAGDCDDSDVAYRPDADEPDCADPNDYNCDGSVGYVDADGDGWAACEECDDAEATTFPGADEHCDSADNDCDGSVDEADAVDATTWYADADTDGYGDPAASLASCEAPEGYGTDATDCDDAAVSVHPGAVELCDDGDVDEDCDALADDADDSVVGQLTSYTDADGDGFGDDAAPGMASCDLPTGAATVAEDCDDTNGAIHPDATELCDSADADEDCDGLADDADPDADGGTLWYVDDDGDGFGDAADPGLAACDLPSGYVADNTDCDDGEATINPGAAEVCDGADVDEDCDGASDDADPSATGESTWYADVDGDGYGGAVGTAACDAPTGSVATSTDCDDTLAAINPGATEVCDGADTDEDCDGAADDADASATGQSSWYADEDEDGYGEASGLFLLCDSSGFLSTNDDDCDDASASAYPGADETCNGADDDCDGAVDEDATDATAWYADADSDGYGDVASSTDACAAPSGYVADANDCDDTIAAINPGATEVCDGADADEDCDGASDDDDTAATGKSRYYADADGDGFGDDGDAGTLVCDAGTGLVADQSDCDDALSAVNPSATETCNGRDDDCDGSSDGDDAADVATWYRDADSDGYGSASTTDLSCAQPTGYVALATDCNDASSAISPAATEVCDSANTDEDCDGSADDLDTAATGKIRYYDDGDHDGYGDEDDVGALYCDPASGLVADHTDCDDARAPISPSGTEVCDGLDNDCDGTTDGDDAADVATWYADADGDTYGDPAATDIACDLPTGFVADDTDCDDTAASVNPMGTETCNSEDDDCDGSVDEDATDLVTWYADADGDTYGDAAVTQLTCSAPSDYVADATDCDDDASGVNPGATERCDSANTDEDCDGLADDADTAATGKSRRYVDADSDGFGDEGDAGALYCDPASTLVASATDCDDTRSAVNPDGTETCNGLDDDCDGVTDGDDSADVLTWYADADGDTYGDPGASDIACYEPSGFVADMNDCDDGAPSVNPSGTETCNGEDDDCDGAIDDGATDFVTWYQDLDGDTYGNSGVSALTCEAPADHVAVDGDCDDGAMSVNPGATEVCDTADTDEDCDGLSDDADPSASGVATWYGDADGDGYGVSDTTTLSCDAPSGYSADDGDCDDGESAVSPGAEEVCGDGIDNDCVADTTCRDWSGAEALADASVTYTGVSVGAVSTTTTGSLGGGVAGGKDINGDGYADVLLADRLYDFGTTATANTGRTYLLVGSATGLTSSLASAQATFTVSTGTNSGDRSGQGVTMLDDVDADGDDEVVIGAYAANFGFTDAGEVCLFKGSSTISGNFTPSSAYITLSGVAANAFAGNQVESVGDVDGDGIADWAVSSGGSTAVSGMVVSGTTATGSYVAGSASLLANITGAGAGAGFADDIDITGDGVSDLVGLAFSTTGAAIFEGGVGFGGSMTTASADSTITGMGALIAHSSSTSSYTRPIANAGDNNGDGYEDLLIGADGYDASVNDVGQAYLFLGPITSSITASSAAATLTGVTTTDTLGKVVGGGGDVDGDGYDDFLVGAPGFDLGGASSVNAGAALLVYGPTSGALTATSAGAYWYGGSGVALGAMARGVGDVDADGYDDFFLGAPATLNGSSAQVGAAYLFYGSGE